jgi:NAD(P)H-nitrite reductase large subunit
MTHYLVIGSGVAGITAVESIRRRDSRGTVTLLHSDPHGYYSMPGLAYLLSGEITSDQLYPYPAQDFTRLGVREILATAAALDLPAQQVILTTGQRLPYDQLLLATGARAVRPRIPGVDLPEALTLDNLGEAQRILTLAEHVRSAVVVGGGITALELAEGLHARGLQVHFLLRGDRFWRAVLDEAESRLVQDHLTRDRIHLHHETELAEILGDNGHVSAVRTASGKVIPCEMVALAIGVRPVKDMAEKAGLRTARGIVVDEYLQTSQPGVYAAGDCAEMIDPLTGLSLLDILWSQSREQGRYAGLNIAGAQLPYQKLPSCNVTRLAGIPTTIIGQVGEGRTSERGIITRGDSEAWSQTPTAEVRSRQVAGAHVRLIIGANSLLGAVVMGEQTLARPLRRLINRQVSLRELRAALLDPASSWQELLLSAAGSEHGDNNDPE